MSGEDNDAKTEYSDAGFPIEIYTDERIREFLAEDKMTPEQKRRIKEKVEGSTKPKPPTETDHS